jgi:hypothetical protein
MDTIILKYWQHWLVSLILFIIVGCLLFSDAFYVENLLRLQFVSNKASFNYERSLMKELILLNNLYLDFVFVIVCSFLFYYSFKVFFELLNIKNKNALLLVFLIPGMFDIIENILTIEMLDDKNVSFTLYYCVVRIKWFLCIPNIIIVLVILCFQVLLGISKCYGFSHRNE